MRSAGADTNPPKSIFCTTRQVRLVVLPIKLEAQCLMLWASGLHYGACHVMEAQHQVPLSMWPHWPWWTLFPSSHQLIHSLCAEWFGEWPPPAGHIGLSAEIGTQVFILRFKSRACICIMLLLGHAGAATPGTHALHHCVPQLLYGFFYLFAVILFF